MLSVVSHLRVKHGGFQLQRDGHLPPLSAQTQSRTAIAGAQRGRVEHCAVREVSIAVTAPFFPHASLELGTGLTRRPGELLALRIDEVAQAHAVPNLLD